MLPTPIPISIPAQRQKQSMCKVTWLGSDRAESQLVPVALGAVEFRHQGYSEKGASNERAAKGIPGCLDVSKSGIPKSKNSSLYWNSFPYEFIPIRKRITGVFFFLEEANSISALKIRLKLPNVISYATPSPHPQPQHTSHCWSHRSTPPCLERGSPTVRGAGNQHGKHMSRIF